MGIKKNLLFFIALLLVIKVPAQLCSGSLGDPIINITFGAGTNPGPILNTTKNLNYSYNDCPNDGSYTVRSNTSSCFVNTWHTLNADHTGDPNGYFMLINASLQKSEFYIDTIKALCPGTTYEFAAWVMNVILPSACSGSSRRPNLTFNIEKIDGTVLQSYTSGDISPSQSPNWNQYGFFFTTPSTVSNLILRLINNSTGGCGNDIAIDDITFRPCGPKLTPSFKDVPGFVKNLCVGDNSEVTFECQVSAGYNNPAYIWQQSKDGGNSWTDIAGENKTTMVRSYASTDPVGTYLYRLTVGETASVGIASCRVSSAPLTVKINPNPVAAITSNSPACQGSTIVLSGAGGLDSAQYIWTGVNAFTATGSSASIKDGRSVHQGKYYLEVKNPNGCRHTDSTTVTVTPAPTIATGFSSKTICVGDSVQLTSSGGSTYLWSPAVSLSSTGIANPVARPADSTVYTVVVSNNFCKDSARVAVHVISAPVANAGPDKAMVEGQSIQLNGMVNGGNVEITWSPVVDINDIHSLHPTVSPLTNRSYSLTATSRLGCGTSTDSTHVRVYKKVIIPNAFSPNGDGINDYWNIPALAAYDNYKLLIINRYGQKVFESFNYTEPWNGFFNGKALPTGTYYYLLDLKLGLPILNGYVVILR